MCASKTVVLLATVWVYSAAVSAGSWMQLETGHAPTGSCMAAVHSGQIWLAQGSSLRYLGEDLNWHVVDSSLIRWNDLYGFSFFLHDGRLIVAGGYNSRNNVYSSDDGFSWSVRGSLPESYYELAYHSSVPFNGVVWFLGGQYTDEYYYEPEGDEYISATFLMPEALGFEGEDWSRLQFSSPPWQPRKEAAALEFRQKLWLFGGQTSQDAPLEYGSQWELLNDIWYTENGETWVEATADAPWCPRSGHTCIEIGGKLWLMGGYDGFRARNDVWISENGIDWTLLTDQAPWRGRTAHASVVYHDKLWIIAGVNGVHTRPWEGYDLSDVWVYDPAASEGEGEGEGETAPQRYYHSADEDTDRTIILSELLRVIQFFNSDGLHCEPCTEDDYNPGAGDQGCRHHDSDYIPSDWRIDLNELLRLIQLYNMGGYHPCETGEDGFCPGLE